MYVIFEDGSRQYRVSVGDTVRLDHREAAVGSNIELDRVLLHADGTNVTIGQPVVAGAKVIAEVTGNPTSKTVIQYFRRRKNYRRLKGHTQPYVEVKIKEIVKS
jgi:large subunit ribosomal protein L21